MYNLEPIHFCETIFRNQDDEYIFSIRLDYLSPYICLLIYINLEESLCNQFFSKIIELPNCL